MDFVVVTSRQHCIEEQTRKWLQDHYPGIFSNIFFGNHWGVGAKRSKVELCEEAGAKALIDDAVEYSVQCAPHLQRVFLFGDYAWNRHTHRTLPPNVQRLPDWEHVGHALGELFSASY